MSLISTETNLIDRLVVGEDAAFRELFDLYYTPLCLYAYSILDSYEEAEDVVQSLFIKLWENNRFARFEGSLRSFLFYSVRNNSLKRVSQTKRVLFKELEICVMLPEEAESSLEELEEELMQKLQELSPQSRRVFEGIVFENLKYKEVAQKLGISINTVKTLFSRSLKQLRESIPIIIIILMA